MASQDHLIKETIVAAWDANICTKKSCVGVLILLIYSIQLYHQYARIDIV